MSKSFDVINRLINTGNPLPPLYGEGSCKRKKPPLPDCPGIRRLYFYDSLPPELLWLGVTVSRCKKK